jgi:hypothetical protein
MIQKDDAIYCDSSQPREMIEGLVRHPPTAMFLFLMLGYVFCGVEGVGDSFYLRSLPFANCSTTRATAIVSIPLNKCLNNHDFSSNKISCQLLAKCQQQLAPIVPYESLVNCTGAPSIPLSVYPTMSADGTILTMKLYDYPLTNQNTHKAHTTL